MKITFLKTKNNTYLFKVPTNTQLIINDTIEIPAYQDYREHESELSVLPKKVVQVVHENPIIHYENVDSTKVLQPSEYTSDRDALLSKRINREDEEDEFATVDDEYAYKKFMAIWKPVRVQTTRYADVDVIIGGMIYSDYKEIVPLTLYGGDIEDRTCTLTLNPVEVLKDICKELDIAIYMEYEQKPKSEYVIELPKHSAIRYAKLNGAYLFADAYDKGYQVRHTYEKCIEELKIYKAGIRKIIVQHIHLQKNKELTKQERKSICDELQVALDILQKVEPSKRTYDAYSKVKEKVATMRKNLSLPV